MLVSEQQLPDQQQQAVQQRLKSGIHTGSRLDSLTSLRFFAAAMIVIHHAHLAFPWIGDVHIFSQAVSFFFVLSGFVLTYAHPQLRTLADIRLFLVARIARIFPAHIAAMFIGLVLVPAIFLPQIASSSGAILIAQLFLVQSWIPSREYFFALNPVSWSISTEMFFYCCFPLFIRSWTRSWRYDWIGKLLLCSGLTVTMIAVASTIPAAMDYCTTISPITRLFEFVLGMFVAQLWIRYRSQVQLSSISATLIEVGCFVLLVAWVTKEAALTMQPENSQHNAFLSLFIGAGNASIFCALIFLMALQRGLLSKLLASRPLVWLGEISYSIYLLHYVILEYIMYHQLALARINQWLVFGIYCFTVMLIANLMYILVERPFRAWLCAVSHKWWLR